MLAVSRRALPLSHSCRNRSESLRETHGELIRKTRHLFEGNDTSGRARSAVSENKTFLKPGFFFCFVVFFRAEKNKRQRRQMFKDAEATEAMK